MTLAIAVALHIIVAVIWVGGSLPTSFCDQARFKAALAQGNKKLVDQMLTGLDKVGFPER